MTKRVKKGVRISLPGGHRRVECIAQEVDGLRCAWGSKSTGRGVCDQPCEGRYCERHARVAAVREAGAALRAASEAVAKARDAVVLSAKHQTKAWAAMPMWASRDDYENCLRRTERDAELLEQAERVEAEARARLEALR